MEVELPVLLLSLEQAHKHAKEVPVVEQAEQEKIKDFFKKIYYFQ